jgi:hypothetical protein
MQTFPFPDGVTYLIIKTCVLILVVLIWLAVTAAPAT